MFSGGSRLESRAWDRRRREMESGSSNETLFSASRAASNSPLHHPRQNLVRFPGCHEMPAVVAGRVDFALHHSGQALGIGPQVHVRLRGKHLNRLFLEAAPDERDVRSDGQLTEVILRYVRVAIDDVGAQLIGPVDDLLHMPRAQRLAAGHRPVHPGGSDEVVGDFPAVLPAQRRDERAGNLAVFGFSESAHPPGYSSALGGYPGPIVGQDNSRIATDRTASLRNASSRTIRSCPSREPSVGSSASDLPCRSWFPRQSGLKPRRNRELGGMSVRHGERSPSAAEPATTPGRSFRLAPDPARAAGSRSATCPRTCACHLTHVCRSPALRDSLSARRVPDAGRLPSIRPLGSTGRCAAQAISSVTGRVGMVRDMPYSILLLQPDTKEVIENDMREASGPFPSRAVAGPTEMPNTVRTLTRPLKRERGNDGIASPGGF